MNFGYGFAFGFSAGIAFTLAVSMLALRGVLARIQMERASAAFVELARRGTGRQ